MPERSSITQITNWGSEGTPGSAIAAGKQMTALAVEMGPTITFDEFRPSGYKYKTIVTPGKDSVEARLTGKPTYTEIVYPLSSLLGTATITTPGGGTASRLWTFNPSTTSPDTVATYTVEVGSSVRAQKFSYGLVTGLTMPFNRESTSITGTMIGQVMSDGITLTGTAAAVSLVPILANQVTVTSDATNGSLGSTTLSRVLSGEFSLTNKAMPLWVVNAANPSWVAHVEVEPQARLKLRVEADSGGMGYLTDARAGTTRFIRIGAVGTVIEAGTINYRMNMDMAAKVVSISDFTDDSGVYAIDFEFDIVHDAGWGKALTVAVTNTLTGL